MTILIAAGIFTSIVLLLEGIYFAFRATQRLRAEKRLRRRLGKLYTSGHIIETIEILQKRNLSEVPWLNRILLRISRFRRLNELLLEQANVQSPLGVFLMLAIILAFVGFWVSLRYTANYLLALVGALFFGMLPVFYLRVKKRKRMARFQEQLPNALELIARSLRAGHAFSGGIKMVADEFADPIGPEFDKTVDEINFGVDFTQALKNLSSRIDCDDLKYFIISVTIQRETGGNLTEILDNIAYIIRERFKLQGKVKALAAEGKFSAYILIGLPFLIALTVFFLNRKYIEILLIDPIGKWMIAISIIMMILGIMVIKGMIKIKV
jgi:tight adherence protein B